MAYPNSQTTTVHSDPRHLTLNAEQRPPTTTTSSTYNIDADIAATERQIQAIQFLSQNEGSMGRALSIINETKRQNHYRKLGKSDKAEEWLEAAKKEVEAWIQHTKRMVEAVEDIRTLK